MSTAGKELCDCGQVATWCYMPGFPDSSNPHVCDDCVNRGCSCNEYSIRDEDYHPAGGIHPGEDDGVEGVDWIWTNDEKTLWAAIDEKGRRYPCCEYMYSEDGWEIETD